MNPTGPAFRPAPAAALQEVSKLGGIAGKVKFGGEKPVMRILSMDAVPQCARQHPEPMKSEEIVVNSNDTLKNAFVWIKSGAPEKKLETPIAAVSPLTTSVAQSRSIFEMAASSADVPFSWAIANAGNDKARRTATRYLIEDSLFMRQD